MKSSSWHGTVTIPEGVEIPVGTKLATSLGEMAIVTRQEGQTLFVRPLRWHEKIPVMWSLFLVFLIVVNAFSTYGYMKQGSLGWAFFSYALTWLLIFDLVRLAIKPLFPPRAGHFKPGGRSEP